MIGIVARMMQGLALLWGLTIVAPATAQSAFANSMTEQLATDPAGSLVRADLEIRTLVRDPRARSDGRLGAAQWVKAQAHFRLGDTEKANAMIALAARNIPAGSTGRVLRANIDLLEGLMAQGRGDIPRAVAEYRAAQSEFIAGRHARGQGQALQALGALYATAGDGDNALRYLNLAREAYNGDDLFRLSLANNLGVAHQANREYAAAAQQYRIALSLSKKLRMVDYSERFQINLATSQLLLNDLAGARRTLNDVGPISQLVSPYHRTQAYRLNAAIALQSGDLITARRFIESALNGVDPANSGVEMVQVHWKAYEIYRAVGNERLALIHLEAMRRLDAIDAAQVASNRTALIAAQFQFSAQNARITRLRAEQLRRDVIFERQRNALQRTVVIITVIGSILALSLLGGLLIVTMRSRDRARRDSEMLAITNAELAQALAAKTDFLAATSHEMRTPLNGILGMTQILLAGRTIDPATRSQIALVHGAGTNLRQLVDDLLDVAKIENGGFSVTMAPAHIADTIRDSVERLRAQAQNAGLALSLDLDLPDESIAIDDGRLGQIVTNLVGNAIKFTADGSVKVTATRAQDDHDESRLVITVADTGIGVSPEWRERIFALFSQVDSTRTRTFGGTGLGLAICRQIARAMHGDVTVADNPGKGSIFTIDLPYTPVTVPTAAPDTDATPPEVWIVCDDPLRTALLTTMVTRSAYQARPVRSDMLDGLIVDLGAMAVATDAPISILCDGNVAMTTRTTIVARGFVAQCRLIVVTSGTADYDDALKIAGEQAVPFALNPIVTLLTQRLAATPDRGTMIAQSVEQAAVGSVPDTDIARRGAMGA